VAATDDDFSEPTVSCYSQNTHPLVTSDQNSATTVIDPAGQKSSALDAQNTRLCRVKTAENHSTTTANHAYRRPTRQTQMDGHHRRGCLCARVSVNGGKRGGKDVITTQIWRIYTMLSTIVTVNKMRVNATAKRMHARRRELFLSAERKARRGLRCVWREMTSVGSETIRRRTTARHNGVRQLCIQGRDTEDITITFEKI